MWRTSRGERTLQGAEAIVFAEALASLLDSAIVDELDDYEFGIECFDNLTFGQKVSSLEVIGNGLLRKDMPPVGLTAALESAIAAVFEHLKNQITFEIDMPGFGTSWRALVVAARKEMEAEVIPELTCEDLDEWDIEIQGLADCILWDADYESAQLFIDSSPERARWLKTIAGISDNYYLAIAEDLTDEEAQARITEVKRLCHSIIGAS
jgi:hypothetical protein